MASEKAANQGEIYKSDFKSLGAEQFNSNQLLIMCLRGIHRPPRARGTKASYVRPMSCALKHEWGEGCGRIIVSKDSETRIKVAVPIMMDYVTEK